MPTRATTAAVLVMALATVAACAGSAPSPSPTDPPTRPTPSALIPRSSAPTPQGPPTDATADGPPAARLAAEGGDPITGQLGTYAWGDAGSDSPWLPGAPIAIGAGEPLTVAFEPAIPVATWQARMVPSAADGPAGASLLGQGAGDPGFAGPAPGSWTVELHVVFAAGRGDASYFWRLDVS